MTYDSLSSRLQPGSKKLPKCDPFCLSHQGLPDFDRVFSQDTLFDVFKMLRSEDTAAGRDGARFGDLSEAEGSSLAGQLARFINTGRYQPEVPRKVEIPKVGGTRTLMIPSIRDRIVGTALKLAWSTPSESIFMDRSYGYRQGLSTWHLLADVTAEVKLGRRPIVAVDDIRNAFDSLSVDDVMAAHEQMLPGKEFDESHNKLRGRWFDMIELCLRGSTTNSRGIGQGHPYSPTALNVTLHFFHDALRKNPPPLPWFRYVDNFVRCCRKLTTVDAARAKTRQLLGKLGLELHKEIHVDLTQGESVNILGYSTSLDDGRVKFRIPEQAMAGWREKLEAAHDSADPSREAQAVAVGIAGTFGPLDEIEGTRLIEVLAAFVVEYGFDGVGSSLLQEKCNSARQRWEKICRRSFAMRSSPLNNELFNPRSLLAINQSPSRSGCAGTHGGRSLQSGESLGARQGTPPTRGPTPESPAACPF